MGPSFKIKADGATDVGRVRSSNQDSFLVDAKQKLFIVADGMGGHAGGEIASQLCIAEVENFLKKQFDEAIENTTFDHRENMITTLLAKSINHASAKIYERALEEPQLSGMGTTATVVKIDSNLAHWAHVGDSRLYLVRCSLIYQVTHDHSLVGEQVRAGIITEEEAEVHQLRNIITRSVGYQEEEDVDCGSLEIEEGDLLLLCSDGLHGKISDREISQLLNSKKTESVQTLIALANERGGDDNISVVVIEVKKTENP
jgi:serine/threonine protein phosphatase PrpC